MFLTQQALSRQIKELEDELGVQLFVRTTRSVTLTPAGEALAAEARAILERLDDAIAAARRTNRAVSGRIRLGFIAGAALELTGPIMAAFREAFPEVEVEMREFPSNDPSAGLASGVTDVAFIRLPQATKDIETELLFVDPVVAMVAETHPLAARTSVSVRDLVREPMTLSDTTDEVYRAFWGLYDVREVPGRFVPVNSVTEETSLVSAGAAVAMTSAAVLTYSRVPGVRFLPVLDWPGSRCALAWHVGERSQVIAGFVDTVCAVRDGAPEIVRRIETRSPENA
ncbi:LysR family transcriptional regulator [Nocardioides maradonensis]